MAGYVQLRQSIPLVSHRHVLESVGWPLTLNIAAKASDDDCSKRESMPPTGGAP